ncbi:hypothetical protein FNX48_018235 [Streptomyces sp. IF17]|nr:hypothetical protein [Streptomyces alkaliphilus]
MVGREISPSGHTEKEIRAVLEKWVSRGWTLRSEGHWGRLYRPCGSRCTTIPISGTPANAGSRARRIDRLASRCPLPEGSPLRRPTGGTGR